MRLLPLAAALAACALSPAPVLAQLPEGNLSEVFPLGGQVGQTLEVEITGSEIDEASELRFSHPGITAAQQTEEKFGRTVPVPRKFAVTIKGDVPPGVYSVRAKGLFGWTNPKRFHVAKLTAVREEERNDEPENAQEIEPNVIVDGRSNGRGEVDCFTFSAEPGTRLLIECLDDELDSLFEPSLTLCRVDGTQLASSIGKPRSVAVLDWTVDSDSLLLLKLHDLSYNYGNKTTGLAYRLKVHAGPRVDFVWPPVVKAGSNAQVTLYGRNLEGGQPAGIELDGGALQQKQVTVSAPQDVATVPESATLPLPAADADAFTYRYSDAGGTAEPVVIGLSSRQPVEEAEADTPQQLSMPFEVVGRFGQNADRDSFDFEGKKDQVVVFDVRSQKLGAPVDAFLIIEQITEKDGEETAKVIQTADDSGSAFVANVLDATSDDPHIVKKLPADGRYRVTLLDRFGGSLSGPERVYHLRVSERTRDFRVVAIPNRPDPKNRNQVGPASVVLRRGGTASLPVYAYRRDGVEAAIFVTAKDLPAGVACRGTVIATGQNSANLIFEASPDAKPVDAQLTLEATAEVMADPTKTAFDPEGKTKTVTHRVRPIAVAWSPVAQNYPPQTRPSDSLTLTVIDRGVPFSLVTDAPTRFTVNQGRQLLIPVTLRRRDGFDQDVKLSVQNIPNGSNLKGPPQITFNKDTGETVLAVTVATNTRPGDYAFDFKLDGKYPKYVRDPQAVVRAKAEQEYFTKYVAEADARAKAAQAALKQKTDAANKAAADAKAAATMKQQADQQVKAAQGDQKPPAEAAAKAAAEALMKAEEARKAAAAAKQEAEAELKRAQDELKNAQNAKKQADQQVQQAEKDKGKDINLSVTTLPVIVTVKPSPVNLSATVPSGGALKRGGEIKVKVRVSRNKDFTGPVTLSLPLPPGVKGLSAAPVTVPPDQKEVEVAIKADGSAAEGAVPNLALQAKMAYNGEAIVDLPVAIKITK